MTTLSKFNKQLLDLTTQIHEMYPNDNNIFVFYSSLKLLIKTNVRKPLEYYNNFVCPYKEQIMNEDETFFKSDLNYSEINNNSIKNLDNIIEILKVKWDSINDNCKKNIWNYLKVLVLLKEQYEREISK